MIQPEQIVGAWGLQRFTIDITDRPPIHPFGTEPDGMLIYSADGHMSAVLSRTDRTPLGVSRLENAHRSEPARRADAFNSYLSYAGQWRIEGNRIIHTVTLALTPEAVGRQNIRYASISQQILTLTYQIVPPSKNVRTYKLVWKKMSADDLAKPVRKLDR